MADLVRWSGLYYVITVLVLGVFSQGIKMVRYANFSLGANQANLANHFYSYFLRRELACRLPRMFSSFFTSAVVACLLMS